MIDYDVQYINKLGDHVDAVITSTDVRTAMNNLFELKPDCKRIIRCKPKDMFED